MSFSSRTFIVLFLLLPPCLEAQHWDSTGVLPRFTAPPVVVSASRLPLSSRNAPTQVTVMDAEEIASLPGHSAADALVQGAGVGLRSYGSDASMRLVSLRGLGSEYTVVLFNGVRINDAQSGVVDLGRLASPHIGLIEVTRGGFSSLYGTDALGGVISITGLSTMSPPSISLGVGSFGGRFVRASAGSQTAGLQWRLSGVLDVAENDFPYRIGGETLSRSGASSERASVLAELRSMEEAQNLSGFFLVSHSDVGIPGAAVGIQQGRARQQDEEMMLGAAWRPFESERRSVSLTTSLRRSEQRYRDPALITNGRPLDSRAVNTALSLASGGEMTSPDLFRLWTGASATFEVLDAVDVPSRPSRLSLALSAGGDLWPVSSLPGLHMFPALRWDLTTELEQSVTRSLLSPSLGISWRVMPGFGLRGRAALGFRSPTFNQLYWQPGGNPDLRPEHALTMDAGLVLEPFATALLVECSVFQHDIQDKIVWTPTGSTIWRPLNIQHVRTQGLEAVLHGGVFQGQLQYRLSIQSILSRKMNSSFSGDRTEGKQLIYIPPISGSLSLLWQPLSWIHSSLALQFSDERYYTETNDASLPSYLMADAAIRFLLPLSETVHWSIKGEVLNLFDTRYETVAFYPMPPRNFRITLTSEFPSLLRIPS